MSSYPPATHRTDEARWRSWFRLRPFQTHGLVLLIAGLVYIGYGLVFLTHHLEDDRRSGIRVALSISHGVQQPWGLVWVLTGALAVISTRWPPRPKLWGYAALSGLAALWSFAYFTGVALEHTGTVNLSGGLVWGLVALMWWAISRLVNPDDYPHAPG